MGALNEIPILWVLDLNIGSETDDIENPYGSGRVTVGSAAGGNLRTLIEHENMPDGIDVSLEDGGYIVWTQMGSLAQNNGVVQRARLDGTEVTDIFRPGEIHTPKQCTIDRTNHKLYVCDREGLRVHRSNLDGSNKEVLVKRGDYSNSDHMADQTRWCVGISVDAKRGKFYWTQKGPSKGGQGRIFRANINMPDGQDAATRDDIETLFENLPEPIDLDMDSDTQTLYWTDRGELPKGNTLNKADVSGNPASSEKREYQILARRLHEAIGLKINDVTKQIYVADLGGDVYRYDMDGKNREKLFDGQGVYTGIALAYLDRSRAQELYGIS